MTVRSPFTALVVLALLAAPACFKSSTFQGSSESSSKSSGSISRSVSSPFASSSRSGGESAYESDVSEYTASWALSGGDVAAFRRGLGDLTAKNGVTNWEQDESTYEGIGRGLRKAGVRGDRLESLKSQLAGPNPKSPAWIQSGYDAGSSD